MTARYLPDRGQERRIGLLGGSFDPAHEGHRHVALTALKRLRLDEVWWIVARGNPLKATSTPFARRLESASDMARHPRLRVSDIEERLGLTFSVETLDVLEAARSRTCFVWIMGSDNLQAFHHWRAWREIAWRVPIAIISRPGYRLSRASVFSRTFQPFRLPEAMARGLACQPAPAWIYLRSREHSASSTALREKPQWP